MQENILQGGLEGLNRNGNKVTTRKVNSVTENIRLNRALWTLADEMAKLTTGSNSGSGSSAVSLV